MSFDREQLQTFPIDPGVYLMKDRQKKVLYVGKAKNLKLRVKQYFSKKGDGRAMIPYLLSHVETIETIVVTSEKEALLLENTLIKKYRPKYNVFLKDDKTYIVLMMNQQHPWPRVLLVRYRGRFKAEGLYFGPYTSAHAARETLDFIQKVFPLRQCNDQELLRRTRPCILYDMKRCVAPCVNKCTKEEYDQLVKQTVDFLKGNDQKVLKSLYKAMKDASEALEFERAAELLKTIRSIEKTVEGQHVDQPLGGDTDVFGLYREGDEALVAQLFYRRGTLTGAASYSFSSCVQEDSALLTSFLMQHYREKEELPHQILLPCSIPERKSLEELLSEEKRRKVGIHVPQKGDKKKLIEMAASNAEASFKQMKDETAILEKTLLQMQERLRLSRYPQLIDCIDQSNLSGKEPVAAIVRFEEGKKETSGYRRYRIREAAPSDDYGAMREVLFRRYQKAKDEGTLPDLLLIDGGKGHLNIALRVLKEINIISMDVIGVAKEEGRHDKGSTAEQVYLPGAKDPLLLKRHSPILFLLQRIRDEAHRFAITYQKKRRSKKLIKSELDEVPGIGSAKKRALLRHFGSLQKIKQATKEEMSLAPGISLGLAEAIWKHFREKK